MPSRISILVAWGCLAVWSSVALAQTRATGSSGSSSSTATQVQATQAQTFSRNTSSSATGGTAGTSTGGSTQAGGAASRSGSTQSRMNTSNQPQFNAGDGTVGARIGQNAFVGQGATTFAGARDVSQASNRSFTPQFNAMSDPSTSQRRANSTTANVKRARPQQRISFEYPKANLVRTQVELSQRFQRLQTVSGAGTSISDDGVAVLTGTVASDEARKLAEALARLEPGVRSVDNQLQVSPATP